MGDKKVKPENMSVMQSTQAAEDLTKPGGAAEGMGKGVTTFGVGDKQITLKDSTKEPEGNSKEDKVTNSFSIKTKDGGSKTFDDFYKFKASYHQDNTLTAENAAAACLAYANQNKERGKALFLKLYDGVLTPEAERVWKNIEHPENKELDDDIKNTKNEADSAVDDLVNDMNKRNKSLKEIYGVEVPQSTLDASDNLFTRNVKDGYIKDAVLGRTIWGNYGVVKNKAIEEGYSEEEAKKIARRNLGVNLLQGLITALGNTSNVINKTGAERIQTDFEKTKESKLLSALERYNEKEKERMYKDIDAVKAYLKNQIDIDTYMNKIAMDATVRNAYTSLDAKHKALVLLEMSKIAGKIDSDKIKDLIKMGFIDMTANGQLANKALGLVDTAVSTGASLIGSK